MTWGLWGIGVPGPGERTAGADPDDPVVHRMVGWDIPQVWRMRGVTPEKLIRRLADDPHGAAHDVLSSIEDNHHGIGHHFTRDPGFADYIADTKGDLNQFHIVFSGTHDPADVDRDSPIWNEADAWSEEQETPLQPGAPVHLHQMKIRPSHARDWTVVPLDRDTRTSWDHRHAHRTAMPTYYHRSPTHLQEQRPDRAMPHTYFYTADDPHDVDWETRAYGDQVYAADLPAEVMEPDPAPRRATDSPVRWWRTDPANVGEMTHLHDPTAPFGVPHRTAMPAPLPEGITFHYHDQPHTVEAHLDGDPIRHEAQKLAMPWRIEHPDYQPADVAKNYNPDIGGTQGGGDSKNFLVGPKNNVWWHGSASGDIGGNDSRIGFHIGDYQTAADVLRCRVGHNPLHPQGRWDGNTSLAEAFPDLFDENGDPVAHRPLKHPDGTLMQGSYRPNVFPVSIVGPMGNTTDTAVSDGQAHALMRRQHTRPPKTPKGYYYINAGEGEGVSDETGIVHAVSATIPSVSHIRKLDPAEHEHIAQEAHDNWFNYEKNRRSVVHSPRIMTHQEWRRLWQEQERRVLEWRNRRRRTEESRS